MAEILTESFCERCGTRYTFEVAAPRSTRVGRLKLLSKGLRNYVMHDDSSLGDAFAAAESEEDRERAAQQLDAFHKTFNFCMSCRQYTCANCWNEIEGRCLTCAPQLGREILPAFVGSDGFVPDHATPQVQEQPTIAASAWPTVDLPSPPAMAEPEPAPSAPEPPALEPALTAFAPAGPSAEPESAAPAAEVAPAEVAPVEIAEPLLAPSLTSVSPIEQAAPPEAPTAAPLAPVTAAAPEPAPAPGAEEALASVAAIEPPTDAGVADTGLPEDVETVAASEAEPPLEAPQPVLVADLLAAAAPPPSAASAPDETGELPPDVAAARGASQTHGLFARFRPEQPAEPVQPWATALIEAAAEPAAPALPTVTAQPAPAEQVLAEVAATAEPVEPEPSGELPPTRPAVDIVSQPVWTTVAPEQAPAPATPSPAPVAPSAPSPAASAAPASPPQRTVWPGTPAASAGAPPAGAPPAGASPQPGSTPAWPSPLGASPAWPPAPPPAPSGVQWPQAPAPSEAVWAESSRDVLNRPGSGVQACVSCGLPLSASARFCRRCGSRQG